LVYVTSRKNWRQEEATNVVTSTKVTRSIPKPWGFLGEPLVCEKLIPKQSPNGTKILPQHVGTIPWKHAKFHEFHTSLGFTRISKPSISMFPAEPRNRGVWNSFPFLAWDLSMYPRTHIWFFNPFWCTGAWACSSTLNYARKMPRKLTKCIKISKQTQNNSKF
jgi:hypothetical protein